MGKTYRKGPGGFHKEGQKETNRKGNPKTFRKIKKTKRKLKEFDEK